MINILAGVLAAIWICFIIVQYIILFVKKGTDRFDYPDGDELWWSIPFPFNIVWAIKQGVGSNERDSRR